MNENFRLSLDTRGLRQQRFGPFSAFCFVFCRYFLDPHNLFNSINLPPKRMQLYRLVKCFVGQYRVAQRRRGTGKKRHVISIVEVIRKEVHGGVKA